MTKKYISTSAADQILKGVYDTLPATPTEGTGCYLVWGADSSSTIIYYYEDDHWDSTISIVPGMVYTCNSVSYVFTKLSASSSSTHAAQEICGGSKEDVIFRWPVNHYAIGSVMLQKSGSGTGTVTLHAGGVAAGIGSAVATATTTATTVNLPVKCNQLILKVTAGSEDQEYTIGTIGFTKV